MDRGYEDVITSAMTWTYAARNEHRVAAARNMSMTEGWEVQERPVDYDEWFTGGGAEPSASIERTWLSLPTGRVVATDPLGGRYDDPPAPFVQVVPPGRYRVDLLITGDRVAAARLVVRDEPAARWERALPERCPDGTGFHAAGYAVDAGTGCFTDERTFQQLAEMPGTDWQLTLLEDLSWMRDGPTVIPRSEVDGSSGENGDENVLVAFPSGEGDGTYGTWVGRSVQGEITCFVTDFLRHDDQ